MTKQKLFLHNQVIVLLHACQQAGYVLWDKIGIFVLLWRVASRSHRSNFLLSFLCALSSLPLEFLLVNKIDSLIQKAASPDIQAFNIYPDITIILITSFSLMSLKLATINRNRRFISSFCNSLNLTLVKELTTKSFIHYPEVDSAYAIQSTIILVNQISKGLINPLTKILFSIFALLGLILGLIRILPTYALLSLAPILIASALYSRASKSKLSNASKSLSKYYTELVEYVEFSVGAIMEIEASNKHSQTLKRVKSIDQSLRNSEEVINTVSEVSKPLLEFLAVITIFLLAASVYYVSRNIAQAFATAATFSLAMQRILPHLTSITAYFNKMRGSKFFALTLKNIISPAPTQKAPDNKSLDELIFLGSNNDNGSSVSVSFVESNTHNANGFEMHVTSSTYKFSRCSCNAHAVDSSSSKIPKYTNFLTISENDKILLRAPSGTGKTTFLLALHKQLNYASKTLDSDFSSYYSPPIGKLFNGSIQDNLTLFEDQFEVNLQKLKVALKCSCFPDHNDFFRDISTSPNFLAFLRSNILNEKFSMGQIQRLTLARALYSNSPFLILDEPFSNLNSKLSQKILDHLCTLRSTIIFVNHDSTICHDALKIIRLARSETSLYTRE